MTVRIWAILYGEQNGSSYLELSKAPHWLAGANFGSFEMNASEYEKGGVVPTFKLWGCFTWTLVNQVAGQLRVQRPTLFLS